MSKIKAMNFNIDFSRFKKIYGAIIINLIHCYGIPEIFNQIMS